MAQTTEPTEDFMDFDEPVSDPLDLSSITGSRLSRRRRSSSMASPAWARPRLPLPSLLRAEGVNPEFRAVVARSDGAELPYPHAVIGAAAPILGTPGMEGVRPAHGMRPPGMGHIQARGSLTRKLTLLPPPSDIPAAYRRSPPPAYAPTRQSST